jgi:hypothetical protein
MQSMSGWKVHFWEGCQKSVIGKLQILYIGFQPLPFGREELTPFGAKLVERVRTFSLGLPRAVFEHLFDLRRVDRWCSHGFFSLVGATRRQEMRLVRSPGRFRFPARL